MRSGYGVFAIVLCFVSLYALTRVANAQEVGHAWNNNLSSSYEENVQHREVTNRYDCDYKNTTSISLNSPFTYLFKTIPVMINPIYASMGENCTIKNQAGLFTSKFIQTSYDTQVYSTHFGSNNNKMYSLHPTITGSVWADPVPSNDIVLVLSRVSPTKTYGVTIYKNFNQGVPTIRSGLLTWDATNTPNSYLKDKNSAAFKIDEHAFSPNGNYMVIRYKSTIAKVNLRTLEMTPVAYEQAPKDNELAISNDGRYIAMLKGELRIVDTQNCSTSYDEESWDYDFYQYSYPGCNTSNNIAQAFRINGVLASGTVLRRPNFQTDNKSLIILVGTKRTDITTTSTAPIAYNWQKLKITANNHVADIQGYLALGDSFSSGEGDTEGGSWYEPGTDEQGNKETFEGRNLCHVSRRSYPYLIAKQLGYLSGNSSVPTTPQDTDLFHSVACSGAVIHNVIGGARSLILKEGTEEDFRISQNQYRNDNLATLGRWQPGRIKQLEILDISIFGGYSKNEPKPKVISIGIGGNDAGFGDIIKACTFPGTCKQAISGSVDASNLAIRLMKLKSKLVETYSKILSASPDSRVYVHGYPRFVHGGEEVCGLNVFLNSKERQLVVEGVKLMNQIVESAAAEAGVYYVHIEDILDGVNLCSGSPEKDMAVNGATAGNDIDFTLCVLRTGCLGSESYHPNPKAHQLYKQAILQMTNNLTKPMPLPTQNNISSPGSFFGAVAESETSLINNGMSTIVIPEPKSFLSTNNQSINIAQGGFVPGSKVRVELQSTPVTVAEFIVPESGAIEETIQLPVEVEPGAHELHLFGITNFGQEVDYYEPIMLAHSDTDFDGDGIPNTEDSCQTIVNSLVDVDQDGIDDACDILSVALDVTEDVNEEVPDETPKPETEEDGSGERSGTPPAPEPAEELDKGLPNPETVAGNEETSDVLGANTSQQSQNSQQETLAAASNLQAARSPAVSGALTGVLIVLLVVLTSKYLSRD